MFPSLVELSWKVIANQIFQDMTANPAQWRVRNNCYIRNGIGNLPDPASLPFWMVIYYPGHQRVGTVPPNLPTVGPNSYPTLFASPYLTIQPPPHGHPVPPGIIVLQIFVNFNLNQNQVEEGWTFSSWDGQTV